MGFTAITKAEIAAGQPVTQGLWQKVKDNDDYLYSQVGEGASGEGGVPNGSFEIDADSDGVPDGWTKNLYPAGGGAIETTNPGHGANAYKFTQQAGPGNGGGYLDQNDYLPCSPVYRMTLSWLHFASVAGMHNIIQIRWFDKEKVYLSTTSIYDSTSNPTSWTRAVASVLPPATAQFWKLRVIGGYTDTDIAGVAYFDGFTFREMKQEILAESNSSGVSGSTTMTIGGASPDDQILGFVDHVGVKTGVSGGGPVAVSYRGVSATITLPEGLWTVVGVGAFIDNDPEEDYIGTFALAVKES